MNNTEEEFGIKGIEPIQAIDQRIYKVQMYACTPCISQNTYDNLTILFRQRSELAMVLLCLPGDKEDELKHTLECIEVINNHIKALLLL